MEVQLNSSEEIGKQKSPDLSEKRRITRNVVIISISWFLLFTAFRSLKFLQSSINRHEGLGTVGLSVVYGSVVLSCLFLPSMVIRKLGCKWTIVVCQLGYVSYTVCNFKNSWFTLMPASVIIGMSAGPMWAAMSSYFKESSRLYAEASQEAADVVATRFYSYLVLGVSATTISGNAISSTIFALGNNPPANYSNFDRSKCGINNCHDDDGNENLKRPDDIKIYILLGVFTLLGVAAVSLIFFIDDMKLSSKVQKFEIKSLFATLRQMKNPYQLLLIPLTLYNGMQQGYLTTDFTKGYVSCTRGIWMIGFVLICNGIAGTLSSIAIERIRKCIGRIQLLSVGGAVHAACIITLIVWRPGDPNTELPIFFTVSGLFGIGEAVMMTQVLVVYAVVFRENPEAAFSARTLWDSMGYIITYSYASTFCMNMKTYVILVMLVIAFVCYFAIELLLYKSQRRLKNLKTDTLLEKQQT